MAVLISLTLLAGAIIGVDWTMGHASSVARVFAGHRNAIIVGETIAAFVGLWLPLFFSGVFTKPKKKVEEIVRLTPLVRRDSLTGLREL
ncbi:MAG: hypothetical protein WDM89_17155 [Rhizomicrobium sp.]